MTTLINKALAEMAYATALINFTTARSDRDLQNHGFWRSDYERDVSIFQSRYDASHSALMDLLKIDESGNLPT